MTIVPAVFYSFHDFKNVSLSGQGQLLQVNTNLLTIGHKTKLRTLAEWCSYLTLLSHLLNISGCVTTAGCLVLPITENQVCQAPLQLQTLKSCLSQ